MSESRRTKRQEFRIEGLPAPLSHYTDAVRFGDILFVSGLTAHNGEGKLVGGADAAAQTRQILLNLKLVLDAAEPRSTRCGRSSLALRGQPAPSSR